MGIYCNRMAIVVTGMFFVMQIFVQLFIHNLFEAIGLSENVVLLAS